MAAIHDLINQIENPELRARIQQEIDQMNKQKKFGLVFEEHLPECTPLYDIPVRRGSTVALKAGKVTETYVVLKLKDDTAVCLPKSGGEPSEIPVADLVSVAEFGEAIYPYLKPIDSVCNAPDSDLWHTLIEADNYHALQLLEYLYAGKVDCIYIDPPYNTGARDWKYNNDYVDGADTYRHSKWLSMMKKRLVIAKRLLNPEDSILMITIDDNELCTLKLLLDSLFSECSIQIVDIVINPKGKARIGRLSQVDEYLLLVYFGRAATVSEKNNVQGEEIRWPYLRRSDVESARGTTKGGTQQFYPIYVDNITNRITKIGTPLRPDQPLTDAEVIYNATAVFPIREDGKHMNWGLTGDSLQYAINNGCVRVTKSANPFQPYNFTYVTMPSIKKMLDGTYIISGVRDDGTKIITLPSGKESQRTTAWKKTAYDANAYGTKLIGQFLLNKRFSFPKSLYSVYDALKVYLENKSSALVIDFFAGSGTTLHAINLLNTEDNGNRRCIMVTNNEVSADEADILSSQGFQPGDPKWEENGIARYVTWPRTVCSIRGCDVNGMPLAGNYGIMEDDYILDEDASIISKSTGKPTARKVYIKTKVQKYPQLERIKKADGFKANAVYFKLSFLDKTNVALGRQFKEMLPILWMKAGAHGPCPELVGEETPTMLVLPVNRFAVLTEEAVFPEFEAAVNTHTEIETVYIVTDYEAGYRAMAKNLIAPNTYQLYRDYLDNFRINTGRN